MPWMAPAAVLRLQKPVARTASRPHHLPGRIVDHRQASGLAARVDLEPQRRWLLCLLTFPEPDGEGVSAVDRRPPTGEQMPRSARMHRSAESPLVLHDQYHRHDAILADSPCAGKGSPVLVCTRYCASPTGSSTPSTGLRGDVQGLGRRRHPKMRTQTLRTNGSWLTPGDWSALGLLPAPGLSRGVADYSKFSRRPLTIAVLADYCVEGESDAPSAPCALRSSNWMGAKDGGDAPGHCSRQGCTQQGIATALESHSAPSVNGSSEGVG